ncbi:MAG: homocysteine S-methyltransferase family protein [bacterium]|nr:homocysteine S-methyltransferase family protein [bacterium]
MKGLLERLAEGAVLVGDGATGTYLQGKGLEVGEAPEIWTLSHPDVVRQMAADYFAAGSDLVETNTFGGNRFRLKHVGLEGRVREVNLKAVELAKSTTPPGGLVIGSIGPVGEFLAPLGTVTPEELLEAFSVQAEALAEGGVDALCVETMTALEEAQIAVRAAQATGLPVMATMTFDEGPRGFATSMGVTIEQAVRGLAEVGADVVGTNCGSGVEQMIRIVQEMGRLTPLPILVQSNAGLPVMEGDQVVYPEGPEGMAARCGEFLEAGARMIGGCCGTGPAHVSAMAKTIRRLGGCE